MGSSLELMVNGRTLGATHRGGLEGVLLSWWCKIRDGKERRAGTGAGCVRLKVAVAPGWAEARRSPGKVRRAAGGRRGEGALAGEEGEQRRSE